MSILTIKEGHCAECYSCIRACPVKAIKMASGRLEILDERCVYCGRCFVACTKGSISLGDDLDRALGLLSSGRKTVAVLAPEYLASFYPMNTAQVLFLVERAGFYSCEETILGEEMVARHYLRHFAGQPETPVIRSTCPAATIWIEKYYPALSGLLAPVATPMVAQARLVKKLYGDDVAVVYATPCIAAKNEAKLGDEVDVVLTFDDFKELLRIRFLQTQGDLAVKDDPKPTLRRRYSVPGGFPRPTIAKHSMLDPALMVVRGVSDIEELAAAIERGEVGAKFIDILTCNGCIDGPAIDTDIGIHLRKQVTERAYKEGLVKASRQLTFDQLEPYLPKIETYKFFAGKQVELEHPDDEALEKILAEGEKRRPQDELDCGACGYDTCREEAVAIYQGIADWSMCFPFQRKIYMRIIKQLQETAVTDGLTGVANHKSFIERLGVEFNRAQRYGSELSLMMVDIDTFKSINDTHGHLAGDETLKAIANTIKDNIRQSDFAARFGGDEFALILPETDVVKAQRVGEKLRRRVEAMTIEVDADTAIKVSLSIGLSSINKQMQDPLSLVKRADEALYEAKRAGRNRMVVAVEEPVEHAEKG